MDINTVFFYKFNEPSKKNYHPLLKADKDIQVFNVNVYDELEQIVFQTKKFVIIIDDLESLNDIDQVYKKLDNFSGIVIFNNKEKTYDDLEQIISSFRFRIINNNRDVDVVSNIELYFFGKIGLLGKANKQAIPTSQSKNAFFTLMNYTGATPQVIVSSHLKEETISDILKKDFDGIITSYLFESFDNLPSEESTVTASNYYEYIYKIEEDMDKAICIIHLNKDENFESKVVKLKEFVSNIKIPKNTY